MIDFVSIGLDIRSKPLSNPISVDCTVWPQEELLCEKLIRELNLVENSFQLIQPKSSKDTNNIQRALSSLDGEARLLSVEIPSSVFYECQGKCKGIWSYVEPVTLINESWKILGYDVCDLNGFFSILHMGVLEKERLVLYQDDCFVDALLLTQTASILVPPHQPFVTVRLREWNLIGSDATKIEPPVI